MKKRSNKKAKGNFLRIQVSLGNAPMAMRIRRMYAYTARFVRGLRRSAKFGSRRFRLLLRKRLIQIVRFVQLRVLCKAPVSDGIRAPKKYPTIALSTKSIAWVLILSLQVITLQKSTGTHSFFRDVEASKNNQYTTSVLDIAVDPGDDFKGEVSPQKSASRTFDIENVGTIPFQYDAVIDNISGAPDVCNEITLEVFEGNTVIHSQSLPDFELPTSRLAVLATGSLDFDAVINSDEGIAGLSCLFDIVWRAWQEGAGPYTDITTLSDTEIFGNSVTVKVTGQGNNGNNGNNNNGNANNKKSNSESPADEDPEEEPLILGFTSEEETTDEVIVEPEEIIDEEQEVIEEENISNTTTEEESTETNTDTSETEL